MSNGTVLFIVHSSHLRSVSEAEVLDAVPAAERAAPRRIVHVNTSSFATDVEGGGWGESDAYLREQAAQIRRLADENGPSRVHYFGLAEIPHLIALGAYVGDEHHVSLHDYDRDKDSWAWPSLDQTKSVDVDGLPSEVITQPGPVVIRVAVSDWIGDDEIEEVLGSGHLADITIRPADGITPARGLVRSEEDVDAVRMAMRRVLAAVAAHRPGANAIHLFVAAPPSVCFALGQELHLRSGTPTQTYRHRRREGERAYVPAILLTHRGAQEVETPLSPEERDLASWVRRVVWRKALEQVVAYAVARRQDYPGARSWYQYFADSRVFDVVRPFPELPPVWVGVQSTDVVAVEPREVDYAFDKDARKWRLSDRLLVQLHRAAGGSDGRLTELIQLFLFHEYLHDNQVLTKYTADDVGSFANSLERIDYYADTFAIFHQLDLFIRNEPERLPDERSRIEFVADQIDLALRSFWAFEPSAPNYVWQERRLRRYLNWFWRSVQVRRADALEMAVRVLSRQPTIELAGLQYRTERGRVFLVLNEIRKGRHLEVGLVLEDGRLWRTGSVGNLSLESLTAAFAQQNHEQISTFFNSLFENASATGGALPTGS